MAGAFNQKEKSPMKTPHDALQTLADRMRCGDAPPHRVRETLEASLVPLVRRVLARAPACRNWSSGSARPCRS